MLEIIQYTSQIDSYPKQSLAIVLMLTLVRFYHTDKLYFKMNFQLMLNPPLS